MELDSVQCPIYYRGAVEFRHRPALHRETTRSPRVHKREKKKDEPQNEEEARQVVVSEDRVSVVSDDQVSIVSPARDRESEAIVQRVTQGLMRRDSRRRFRSFFRLFLTWALVAGALYGLWYFFGHLFPTDLLNDWWTDIESKLAPVFESEPTDS